MKTFEILIKNIDYPKNCSIFFMSVSSLNKTLVVTSQVINGSPDVTFKEFCCTFKIWLLFSKFGATSIVVIIVAADFVDYE